jgi:hypothetical protein
VKLLDPVPGRLSSAREETSWGGRDACLEEEEEEEEVPGKDGEAFRSGVPTLAPSS